MKTSREVLYDIRSIKRNPCHRSDSNTSLNSLLPGEMQSQNTVTGLFFMEQTPESLNAAIEQFEKMQFDEEHIKKHAANFSKEVFQEKLVRFIEEKLQEKKS